MVRQWRHAAEQALLEIPAGTLDTDEATIAAVRAATKKPLRVDANEGWKTKEEAVRKINWLEKQGVEFVEQPMPAEMVEETRWVRSRVHIPIIADEACQHAADIPKLAGAFDGINVKLDKAGGILEGYRWIQMAKSLGMKTMLGCMISSSVSVTAPLARARVRNSTRARAVAGSSWAAAARATVSGARRSAHSDWAA